MRINTNWEVRMRKVLVVMFTGFMLFIASAYNVYAEMPGCAGRTEGGMHMHMGERGGGMWMVFKGLDLNEQQRGEIRAIRSATMKEAIKKRADIKVARIELRELLQKDSVDMNAVEGKLKQIASLQTDLRLSMIKAMQEMKSKLTPEQRAKLKENFRKHMVWKHEGRHGCICGKGKMGEHHEKAMKHHHEDSE
jgi:Spy/CpxP family protein refolding chaperone